MASGNYGKRKKKADPCPNPLFIHWLTEWRDSAAEKGMKSRYNYQKAMQTLLKYPLRLESGKECKVLENFGDKICKMLDDKLEEYKAEYGTTEPIPGVIDIPEAKEPAKRSRSKKQNKQVEGGIQVPAPPGGDGMYKGRPKARCKSREYVPLPRSGGYGLIVTLYKKTQARLEDTSGAGFMTKQELMKQAQGLSDSSFSIPVPGCRYTAWSSMGTLIKKGYITKAGSPARYSITDSGCELAVKLLAADGEDVTMVTNNSGSTKNNVRVGVTSSVLNDRLPTLCEPADEHVEEGYGSETERFRDHVMSSEAPYFATTDSRLAFWYVNDNGMTVPVKDKAAVLIDDEISIGFLVKCLYEDLLMSGKRYKLDTSRSAVGDYIFAYLHNEDAPDSANAPAVFSPSQPRPSHKSHTVTNSNTGTSKTMVVPPASKSIPVSGMFRESTTAISEMELPDLESNGADFPVSITTESDTIETDLPNNRFDKGLASRLGLDGRSGQSVSALSINASVKTNTTKNTTCVRSSSADEKTRSSSADHRQWSASAFKPSLPARVGSALSTTSDVPSTSSISEGSQDSVQPTVVPEFTLRPGTFDLLLIVDNHEHFGSGNPKQTIAPELRKNGVAFEIRALNIGDFLWIARERPLYSSGGIRREVVLDHIIERKRMDDLAGSIVDGRFREQKFRLKNCGLANPILLIEDYGSVQHFSVPEETLRQAITNTQVIDGFYIKRSRDTKESMAYLTLMTKQLNKIYSNKTLEAYTMASLKLLKQKNYLQDAVLKVPIYEQFNNHSTKSKALSVQQMFAKQLIQLQGMTAEKAAVVINHCQTPANLYTLYSHCISEKEREVLLSSLKFGPMQRKLGDALSKQVYMMYCKDEAR